MKSIGWASLTVTVDADLNGDEIVARTLEAGRILGSDLVGARTGWRPTGSVVCHVSSVVRQVIRLSPAVWTPSTRPHTA